MVFFFKLLFIKIRIFKLERTLEIESQRWTQPWELSNQKFMLWQAVCSAHPGAPTSSWLSAPQSGQVPGTPGFMGAPHAYQFIKRILVFLPVTG